MRLTTSLAVTVALLAGCATATTADAGKAIAVAWASLDGAALSADTAVKAGKLHGANAAMVSADLTKARDALKIATDAYMGVAGAQKVDPVAEAAVATAAIAEITAIVTGVQQ